MHSSFFDQKPVVAIFRAPTADRFVEVGSVLYDAGIRHLEFTLTSMGALDAVRAARKALPADVTLAVGTIRTEDHVEQAAEAGAEFLVSQTFRPDLVERARGLGLPFVPGALTPTEIVTAWEAGVPAVKVSPIGPVGGLAYLKELTGPLPDVPMFPTGGVRIEDVAPYLAAGAAGVGISGFLLGDALLPDGDDLDALADRARTLVASLGGAA